MMLRKQKMILFTSLICILFAGLIFLYNNVIIPRMILAKEKAVRAEIDVNAMPRKQVAVVKDKDGITKYTVLTDQIIDQKIELIAIPEKFVVKGAAIDLDMIKEKITKEDLRLGEQIVSDSLSNDKKWFGNYERLKEYEIKSIVADEVKPGNIVDIAVSYGNGKYDVVVPKIKVRKLITVEDKEKKKNKYTIIIAVDEVMYRDLELAGKLGSLETRLYLDESQPASPKTFDYFKRDGTAPSNKNTQAGAIGTIGL